MGTNQLLSGAELRRISTAAQKALMSNPRLDPLEASSELPTGHGIYAILCDDSGLRDLGISPRKNQGRPIYVGKAESKGIAYRFTKQHLVKTGKSSPRRSFAALLRDDLGLKGMPRTPANPESFSTWGMSSEDDAKLTGWMEQHLSVSAWEKPRGVKALLPIETQIIKDWQPPINRTHMLRPTELGQRIRTIREVFTQEARQWARDRGFDVPPVRRRKA